MGVQEQFWSHCNEELFTVGTCQSCSQAHFYPQLFCPHCGSKHVELRPSKGKGRVVSYSHVMSSFYSKGFDFPLPYTVVLVELDEGVQIVSKMLEYSPNINIGNPVMVGFESRGDKKIPVFMK